MRLFIIAIFFSINIFSQENNYFGLIKENIPEEEKYTYPKGELPSSYSNPVTPVQDQGPCPSCVAFASINALESLLLRNNFVPKDCLNL